MALVQEENVQNKLSHHENSRQILGPAPSLPAHDKGPADEWSKGRRRSEGDAVAHHRRSTLSWAPYINNGATGDGDWGAAKHTGKEARNEDGLDIFGCGGAKREGSADKVGL